MPSAEFEERAYEAPLYNQLERGNLDVYTPGQVLESRVGFDRGLFIGELALWQTLGFKAPPLGASLGYYDWPSYWGPPAPRYDFPRFRLNLFIQAKRPELRKRLPVQMRSAVPRQATIWSFDIEPKQQRLLETLAQKVHRRAHVTYAAAAFHTYVDLFRHTKLGTIVDNSTFPSVARLTGHERWYYWSPGAEGVANPDPEYIEEPDLLSRLRGEQFNAFGERGGLTWLDELGAQVEAAVREAPTDDDVRAAQFFDDIRTFDRLVEPFELRPTLQAFFHVRIFATRFSLSWLVVASPS